MYRKKMTAAILFLFALLSMCFSSFAETKEEQPLSLVAVSEAVDGKVNDPVSKKTIKARIFSENPYFRIDSTLSSIREVDVIVYSNEYVEGEDRGIRNRVVKKTVRVGESFSLLPEEIYDEAEENGSLYDFVNRCFVLRIFTDTVDSQYIDSYIGIVEDNIYSEMYDAQEENLAATKARNAILGPAAKSS